MKPTPALFILLLATATGAQAGLRADPEISSVTLDPEDANRIHLGINGLSCKAAISTNGGLSFAVTSEFNIPPEWSTNLTAGTRRYVLVDSVYLFRSDDSGVTWMNTGATSFLREQCQVAEEREEEQFREKYGSRLPRRSPFWHLLFGVYACGYFLVTSYLLRHHGVLRAIQTSLSGLAVLLVIWSLLAGFHAVMTNWTDSQYPMAFWNTSARMQPSPKLGLAMAITALPLPLFMYLVVLWPILPGSIDVLTCAFTQARRRQVLTISIASGAAFVLFHILMMLLGYFWE